jgi:MoxR-like ATPase
MRKTTKEFILEANARYGGSLDRPTAIALAEEMGQKAPAWLFQNPEYRLTRGMYKVPEIDDNAQVVMQGNVIPMQKPEAPATLSAEFDGFKDNLIPENDPLFVPFGSFKTIKQIIASNMFYPVYVTGLSGNGKTFSVEQACAQLKREVIRVNFTLETDEDDLIGGFRLVNGDTKFFKGPVINAMERGAVLLLDEIDLANPAKVMCLQSILEGKGYFIKKTGEFIKPADGFTVVATGNTKGKGSEDGRFIGTNVMNEAFLERFPITCEQDYPTPAIEKKILGKVFENLCVNDDEYCEKLIDWADIIRKTFYDGGVDEVISTRRLVHIAKAYSIFENRMTAIDMCINRFDEDTKQSFRELYEKIDADVLSVESENQISNLYEEQISY